MTTPNEELLERAKRLRHELGDSNSRLDRQGVTAMYEMEQALQSQAERIAMLESLNELAVKQAETLVKQRDTLRAELEAIAAIKPYCFHWVDRWGCNHYADPKESIGPNAQPLFTHPMPAESKDAERYRWLRSRPIDWSIEHHHNGWTTSYGCNDLDAAIDAAIAKGAKQ